MDVVIAEAWAAHADEFIVTLPRGYDTPLGEGGARLSGGQRQRGGYRPRVPEGCAGAHPGRGHGQPGRQE